jgi:hypothetical protein
MAIEHLTVTRESVCMADDAYAPHEEKFSFSPSLTLRDAIRKISEGPYLASIAGGRATWIAWHEEIRVAVVAQQWTEPKFLPNIDRALAIGSAPELYFQYLAQKDPEAVFADCNSHD